MRVLLPALMWLCGAAFAAASEDYPRGPLPRVVVPERAALELRIDPAQEGFSGRARFELRVEAETDTLWLHGRDLTIDAVSLRTAEGEQLPLEADVVDAEGGVLRLTAPTRLAPGRATLQLDYRARYSPNMQGAYKVRAGADAYVVTQMEPLGARQAFPSFDEPSFKIPWDIRLIVPAGQQAFANTAQIGIDKVEDGWRALRFATTEPLPSYLIAFAVGPWDVVRWDDIPANAVRTHPLPLRGIAARGRGPQLDYALRHTAALVAALETWFDSPYPFDKLDLLAAPDFSYGAMENAGLIVYRDVLLLGVDHAPTQLRQRYWGTHAHELAHQWFGNLVTMPWWDDLWLNEAFATWMATKTVHPLQPGFHADRRLLEASLAAMDEDSLASARRIHEPVHDHTDAMAAFDGITYQKGGAVLSMFESYLGPDRFRAALRAHMRQFARGNATSADLMRSLAAQSDRPGALQAAFASFTDQPGVPLLHTRIDCSGSQPQLIVRQSRFLPLGSSANPAQRWGIPACLRLPDGEGTRRQCMLIDQAEQSIALEVPSCPAWLHPNADGAGYYRYAQAAPDRAQLDAAFRHLNPREQRVHADSITAAWSSGSLTTTDWLASARMMAASPLRDVAAAPLKTLHWIERHLVANAAQREALQQWVRTAYGAHSTRLGLDARPDDDDEVRLLRRDVVQAMALLGRDPELRKRLAERGRRVLGLGPGGRPDPDAIGRDLRSLALQMASEHGGEAEFEALLGQLRASSDAVLRIELLWAIGSTPVAELQARARDLVLQDTVRSGEVPRMMPALLDASGARAATRQWVRDHFEALFAKVPLPWQANLSGWDGWEACDAGEAAALEGRYRTRLARVEGGPRTLDQIVEKVRLCAALRAHHVRNGLNAALTRAADARSSDQRGAAAASAPWPPTRAMKSRASASVGARRG